MNSPPQKDESLGFSLVDNLHEDWIITDGPSSFEVKREDIPALESYLEKDFVNVKACPYCQRTLSVADGSISKDHDEQLFESTIKVWACPYCAYWQLYETSFIDRPPSGMVPAYNWVAAAASKLRSFNGEMPDGCEAELAQYLRRKPDLWHTMDPIRLETLVAAIFRANYQSCEVTHVGKTGDGGKDVVFVDSGGNQWLIQVKRRMKANASEGVSTLRNLLGAMFLHKSQHGVIVSTADHFTTFALKEAKKAEGLGMKVEMFDRGKLNLLVGKLLPPRPWLAAIEYMAPERVDWFRDAIPELKAETCQLQLDKGAG